MENALANRPARVSARGLVSIGWLLALGVLLPLPAWSYAQPVATADHRLAIRQAAVIAHGVLHYGEQHLRHQGERCAALDTQIRGACYARMSRDALSLAAGTPPTLACPVLAAQLTDYFQASALLMNACAQGQPCFNGSRPVRVEILRGAVRHLIATGLNGVCD
jgi:hypothetical protein